MQDARLRAPTTPPVVLTITETSKTMKLGRTMIFQLIKQGDLDAVHFGRAVRVVASSIDALVERKLSE